MTSKQKPDDLLTGADLVRAAKLLRAHAAEIRLSEFNFHSRKWDDIRAHDEYSERLELARKLSALAEALLKTKYVARRAQ